MRGDVAITADAERSRLVLLNFIVEDWDDERVDVAVTVLSLDDNLGLWWKIMRRKSLTRSVKVALPFFWGLYRHVFYQKEGFIACKQSPPLAYPQIKPFVGGFICKSPPLALSANLSRALLFRRALLLIFLYYVKKGLIRKTWWLRGVVCVRNQLKVTVIKYPTALRALVFFHLLSPFLFTPSLLNNPLPTYIPICLLPIFIFIFIIISEEQWLHKY